MCANKQQQQQQQNKKKKAKRNGKRKSKLDIYAADRQTTATKK